jgi:hypothetical protein
MADIERQRARREIARLEAVTKAWDDAGLVPTRVELDARAGPWTAIGETRGESGYYYDPAAVESSGFELQAEDGRRVVVPKGVRLVVSGSHPRQTRHGEGHHSEDHAPVTVELPTGVAWWMHLPQTPSAHDPYRTSERALTLESQTDVPIELVESAELLAIHPPRIVERPDGVRRWRVLCGALILASVGAAAAEESQAVLLAFGGVMLVLILIMAFLPTPFVTVEPCTGPRDGARLGHVGRRPAPETAGLHPVAPGD